MLYTLAITTVVAVSTWMSPMPTHASGWLVLYGNERLARANAEYRGYDLGGYACGLSVMSPADLGRVVWVRADGGTWFGPCLAVDTSARKDFFANVYVRGEVAEVDDRAAQAIGFANGVRGEAFVGRCPPVKSDARRYQPDLVVDEYTPELSYLSAFWPYPRQERPIFCGTANPFMDFDLWQPRNQITQ